MDKKDSGKMDRPSALAIIQADPYQYQQVFKQAPELEGDP